MHSTIPKLIEKDSVFATIIALYGEPAFITRPEGFESMCKTILEQQVSLSSARASYRKLKNLVLDITPENIVNTSEHQLRECGISRQKNVYLKALAQAVMDGTIDFSRYRTMPPDAVRQELIQVKGIGNWTIDVYLMFSLQSPDILPLGDIGIISAIKDLWGLNSMEDIAEHATKWSPYRTSAAFFLWHYYLAKRGRTFPH
jgi:DNA-3-methyladenine glycosylase II